MAGGGWIDTSNLEISMNISSIEDIEGIGLILDGDEVVGVYVDLDLESKNDKIRSIYLAIKGVSVPELRQFVKYTQEYPWTNELVDNIGLNDGSKGGFPNDYREKAREFGVTL